APLGKFNRLFKVNTANENGLQNNINNYWRMNDNMLEPSIDVLQNRINSKYSLVILSAKRAKQILELQNPMIENPQSHTYVGVALEEIEAGKLTLEEND